MALFSLVFIKCKNEHRKDQRTHEMITSTYMYHSQKRINKKINPSTANYILYVVDIKITLYNPLGGDT